jgi:tetratricopeptide (TPR) repeat protein
MLAAPSEPSREDRVTARQASLASAAAVVAAIAAVYGRTLAHGFAFDDQMLVVDNPLVRWPLSRGLEVVARSGAGASYRPLRVLSYQLDHALAGGLVPAVFHASNLAWHAAACLTLLSLARATIGSRAGALFAALLFAVHPLGSEAVAYVAGRRDLVCSAFALLALRAWWWLLDVGAYGRRRGARPVARCAAAAIATLVAAALAVGAKETALVLPVLAALLLAVHRRRATLAGSSGAAAPFLAALAAMALALAAAAALLYGDRIAPIAARIGGPPLAPQPALSLRVLGRYASLAVWPVHLSADYRDGAWDLPRAAIDIGAVGAAGALVAALAGGAWLAWRGSIAGAGILWFFASLLPVAQVVPYAEVIAEHNAYLGLAGLALAAGEGFAVAMRLRPRVAVAAGGVLLVVLAARSFVRAGDWRDDATLWAATADVAPRSLRARYNLGVALVEANRLLEGREALVAAHELAPADRDVILALAGVEARLGDHDRALELARQALAERRDASALVALGWAQLGSGDARGAAASFEEALASGGAEEARRGLALARRRRVP